MTHADRYRYAYGERRPIEILVFTMDPADVDDFLVIDHEIWTLGEAFMEGADAIPFLSKEVWLNDSRPGRVTIVIEWPDATSWKRVDDPSFQAELTAAFNERFGRPYELVREVHDEESMGLHRWSRFER